MLCPWPIPPPHDWVTRVHRALTKKSRKPCKPLSSEAAPTAQSHGKRQPPNNADSNPRFAPGGRPKTAIDDSILNYWTHPFFFAPNINSERELKIEPQP